jgi:hypothetical protein
MAPVFYEADLADRAMIVDPLNYDVASSEEQALVDEDSFGSMAPAASAPASGTSTSLSLSQWSTRTQQSRSKFPAAPGARSNKDAIAISERLHRAGADLVSLSEKIDTTSAADSATVARTSPLVTV